MAYEVMHDCGAHKSSAWMDSQRRERASGRGRLKAVGICVHRLRDSPAGRQAYIQGSTLAVWEVMLLVGSYKTDTSVLARHLRWPEVRVHAAVNYAGAFPEEIKAVMAEYDSTDFGVLKRMLPQAADFFSRKATKN